DSDHAKTYAVAGRDRPHCGHRWIRIEQNGFGRQQATGSHSAGLDKFTTRKIILHRFSLRTDWWCQKHFMVGLVLQRLHGDFFKENNVIVTVVLQANEAFNRPPPALRFEGKLHGWHRVAFRKLADRHTV